MTSNIVPIPINRLPPELLQSVWRYLSFFQLLRCQQVCKGWKNYLPGNDSILRRVLFSPEAASEQPFRAETFWPVFVDYKEHTTRILGLPPQLTYTLELCVSEGHYTNNANESIHPIIAKLHHFARLVHPEFKYGTAGSMFKFDNPYYIEELSTWPEQRRESWQDMLACIPPVREADIHLAWRSKISRFEYDLNWKIYKVKNPAGISVWDFVIALREALLLAKTVVPSIWANSSY